ncbi:MAG: 30S ribosomal protein S21 [Saprospiraceae bacterium]
MLIIERSTGETVDKMLRRYKRKHRDVRLRNELRSRKEFTKKSVKRRREVQKAAYKEQKQEE